jgi:hypothetical protein
MTTADDPGSSRLFVRASATLRRPGTDLQNQIQVAEFMPEIAQADRLRIGCINDRWLDERRQ